MFKKVKDILSSEEIKQLLPLPKDLALLKARRDEELKNILSGKDNRFVFIIGPCSADSEDSVCDYVARLSRLSERVEDKIFIIPRIYTNKPRSRGEGYKGIMHQPDPTKATDIQEGILALRRMHLRAIGESGLTAADEMLYPENFEYVGDLLSYNTIGARSSENQLHRLVASGIDGAVGIKNAMNGSFSVLLNSIFAAQIPNEFKYLTAQVETSGNPFAHAVLRGAVDVFGNNIANYHYEDVIKFSKLYLASGLKNPSIIIDVNHSNSNKNPLEQIRIVKEILTNRKDSAEYSAYLRGVMVESYIEDGNQAIDQNEIIYGKSLTDGCLGWEKTERMILEAADKL